MKRLVDAEIVKETDRAYLIKGPLEGNGTYQTWFPKSEVGLETFANGTVGDIFAEDWILEKKEEEIGDYILIA